MPDLLLCVRVQIIQGSLFVIVVDATGLRRNRENRPSVSTPVPDQFFVASEFNFRFRVPFLGFPGWTLRRELATLETLVHFMQTLETRFDFSSGFCVRLTHGKHDRRIGHSEQGRAATAGAAAAAARET